MGNLTNPNNKILKLLRKLEQEVKSLKNNTGTPKLFTKTQHVRRSTSKYCWLHGTVSHSSKDCKEQFRKDGHKVEAEFSRKMNGSKNIANE